MPHPAPPRTTGPNRALPSRTVPCHAQKTTRKDRTLPNPLISQSMPYLTLPNGTQPRPARPCLKKHWEGWNTTRPTDFSVPSLTKPHQAAPHQIAPNPARPSLAKPYDCSSNAVTLKQPNGPRFSGLKSPMPMYSPASVNKRCASSIPSRLSLMTRSNLAPQQSNRGR